MELLDLSKIEYRLAADLKLINILLGISSHSGKYACFVCYGPCNLVSGPLCTYQHLEDMYLEYAAAGFPVKKMSLFYNVIKPCLINPSNMELYIGNQIPLPQLHLNIGIGNLGWDLVKVIDILICINDYIYRISWAKLDILSLQTGLTLYPSLSRATKVRS